ncbi:hypothetical protein NDU88_007644 [Pleurodeles waltl]|uniref:Uncharacterized protein n=1 Tax=Pleurodeles waltl TaxID=8319 RepID=A0AAV7PS17_PLEWA|nr:hypothetical protein NDU88_007644 [Pleurodeles waltl]
MLCNFWGTQDRRSDLETDDAVQDLNICCMRPFGVRRRRVASGGGWRQRGLEPQTLRRGDKEDLFPGARNMGRLRFGTGSAPSTRSAGPPSSLDCKPDAVLEAMERLGTSQGQIRLSLEQKIDTMATDLNLLQAGHRKLTDKSHTMERTLHKLIPKTQRVDASVQSLLDRVTALESRVKDSKGRSQRNNIQVVGLTEGVERSDCKDHSSTVLFDFHFISGTLL